MVDKSLKSRIKSLVIGALIFVTVGGSVAFTPRYFFWGHSDFGCCPDAGAGYDWLGIFVVVPFVLGVALATGVVKSWLDDRSATTNRLL
jgi:hypothetical protein